MLEKRLKIKTPQKRDDKRNFDQLMKNYLPLIKGKKWYHQRFDGSPMFLYAVGEAHLKPDRRRPAGTEALVSVCFFEDRIADWYIDMQDITRGSRAMIKLAKKDRNVSAKLLRAWSGDEQRFEKFFWKEFPSINLKRLSDPELLELWRRYYALFINRFTSSALIDNFSLGTDELIGRMLRKEIGQRASGSDFVRFFSIATAPTKQSFINQAEIDLLKIVLKKTKKTVRDHQKKYFWIRNNYIVAKELGVDFFREEINVWNKGKIHARAELEKIQSAPQRNKREKQKLMTKYGLSELLRTLIKISDDFTWWQDERKKSTY
ncbi:MAG: hypothetical protein Q8R08_01230, partial [bacterium]|nr:hypothetical protein [bacterium]